MLIFDVRYNAFYKMYRELQQNNVSIQWSENYAYSWKLSSKMYEIWCFIKMCRFLISDKIGIMILNVKNKLELIKMIISQNIVED